MLAAAGLVPAGKAQAAAYIYSVSMDGSPMMSIGRPRIWDWGAEGASGEAKKAIDHDLRATCGRRSPTSQKVRTSFLLEEIKLASIFASVGARCSHILNVSFFNFPYQIDDAKLITGAWDFTAISEFLTSFFSRKTYTN